MTDHNPYQFPDLPVGPFLEPLKGSPVFDLLKRQLTEFRMSNEIPSDQFFKILTDMEKELSLFAAEQAAAQLYQIDADKSYIKMIKYQPGTEVRKSWEDHWNDRNKARDAADRRAQNHLMAFHGLVRNLRDFT